MAREPGTATSASTGQLRRAPRTPWRRCGGTSSSSATWPRLSSSRPWRPTSPGTRRCGAGWPRRAPRRPPRAGGRRSAAPALRLARRCLRGGAGDGRACLVRPGTGTAMYYLWLARGRSDAAMRSRWSAPPRTGGTGATRSAPTWRPRRARRCAVPSACCSPTRASTTGASATAAPSPWSSPTPSSASPDSISKVAGLVRTFAHLGCQQLQLNALNASRLLDAKAHPERAPRPHRARLGLERLLLRALARVPGSRHLPAPVRRGLRVASHWLGRRPAGRCRYGAGRRRAPPWKGTRSTGRWAAIRVRCESGQRT